MFVPTMMPPPKLLVSLTSLADMALWAQSFVKGSDCHEMAGLELVVFRELIQPYDGHGLLRCLLTGRGAVTRSDIVFIVLLLH